MAFPESPEVRGSERLWLFQKVLRSGGLSPLLFLIISALQATLFQILLRISLLVCMEGNQKPDGVSISVSMCLSKTLWGTGVLTVLQPQIRDHSVGLFSACYTEYTVYWPISDGLLPESTSKCDVGMLNTW